MGTQGCRSIAITFNKLQRHRSTTVGKTFVAECLKANQYALACSGAGRCVASGHARYPSTRSGRWT